jgi:uncharacterized membrane protein
MRGFVFNGLIYTALLSSSMLAGLMAVLLAVMRKAWSAQPDLLAAREFKQFLTFAAKNRVLSTLSVLPVLCPALAVCFRPRGTPPLAFALGGCGVFLLGFFVWTALFNLPIYRAVERWDVAEVPADLRAMLRRFHTANAVRLAAALCASALFFVAKS